MKATIIEKNEQISIIESPEKITFTVPAINEKIDIKENRLLNIGRNILEILLTDRTTNENIIWATNDYKKLGSDYEFNKSINIDLITGENGEVIKPRIEKTKDEKKKRSKQRAEIFTPSWICNCQNNLIDTAWFGRENVFNTEKEKSWNTKPRKITFPKDKSWQDYCMQTRLEITCGEAPYLVSRYDTTTGDVIPIKKRIGLLDRKLRIVSENTDNVEDWVYWAIESFKHIIGYEYQGDNVLLARENLLYTFIDYYQEKWKCEPSVSILEEIAYIISWNIWQMDGLKQVIPNSCENSKPKQLSFLDDAKKGECVGCRTNNDFAHIGIYCKIMDWEKSRPIRFADLLKRGC